MDKISPRQSGILLHPTALPGPYGIGEIGLEAYKFIDSLFEMGQSIWQILPLGPTDFRHSPYSSISTFSGNHLLISLDLLAEEGLIAPDELTRHPEFDSGKVLFDEVTWYKMAILNKVCQKKLNKLKLY